MHCGHFVAGSTFPVKIKLFFFFNPFLTNGVSHHYLDESTSSSRGTRSDFKLLVFDEIPPSKQNSLRWDTTFCSVIPGAILFAYVPTIGHQATC